MNINLEHLLALLGAKEFDLFNMNREKEELRKRLSAAEERIAGLEKAKESSAQ